MIETLANGYSSDSAHQELSNEYHHDRVKMIFIIFCFFVHWTKVTSASEWLFYPTVDLFQAFKTLSVISAASGDFLYRRFLTDVLPKTLETLTRLSPARYSKNIQFLH